jgi:hypothetical protein
MSASAYRRSKNVLIKAVIIPELKFRDVQRHVFGADLVEAANDTALEDAPEAFNRIGVDRADNVLTRAVVDRLMIVVGQPAIGRIVIGRKQADLVADRLVNEGLQVLFADELQNASDHVALALHRADDGRLGAGGVLAALAALADVFVFVFAPDPRFVHLNDAAKLVHVIFDKSNADAMAHIPSGFVRAEAHRPHDLKGTHSLLAGQHHVSDAKPVLQRLVGVLEDRPRDVGEAIASRAARSAGGALPVKARLEGIDLEIAAARAMDPVRPTAGDQVGPASFLVGESILELADRHLMNWLGALRHQFLPPSNRRT